MQAPSTDPGARVPLSFVVGTGRCGSTLLSSIVRTHPAVLSLSELFATLQPHAFPAGEVDGEVFVRLLTGTQLRQRVLLGSGVAGREVLYPGKPGQAEVAPILLTPLPHLTDDPHGLLAELVAFASSLEPAPVGTQYERLFSWLAARFGNTIAVERSGASLWYAGALVKHFPEARFVHLHRDGRAVALSMASQSSFRLTVVRAQLVPVLGFDPYDEPDRPIPDSFPEELRCALPRSFDGEAFMRLPVPLADFGRLWSTTVLRGLRVLDALPAERVLHLAYEELVEDPASHIARVLDFIGVAAPSAAWSAAADALVERRASGWTELPADERDALTEACAPGMERLGRSVHARRRAPKPGPVKRGLPPGAPRWQRRAERRWLDDIGGLLLDCQERYGDVFTLPAPGLHGPESTRAVIAANPREVYDLLRAGSELNTAGDCRERVVRFAGPQSIFIVEGATHIHRRRLMLPRFHRRSVERLGGTIHEIVDAEIDSWPLGEPFALAKGLSAMTFGLLVRIVFGPVDADWQARLGRGVRSAAQPWDGPRVVERTDSDERRELDDLLYERIALHRAGEVRTDGDDFLSAFIEATDEDGVPLDDAAVHDELLSLLLAGHDSVAITLTWALDHILRDPALIATLREEAEAGESSRIDAVVSEVLRLHPPLPLVARTLAVPVTVGGYELDAGTVVVPCIWLAQRSAESYEDPHEFKPERFLDAAAQPQEWMAFGAGTRRCLGAVFADYQLRHVLQRILTRTSLDVLGPQSRYGSWRMVGLWPGSTRSVLRERRGAVTVA